MSVCACRYLRINTLNKLLFLCSLVESSKFVLILDDFSLSGLRQDRVYSFLGGEHLIELRYIEDILGYLRFEVWLDFLGQKCFDVYVIEPWMLQYLINTILGANSLLRIFLEALGDEIFAFIAHLNSMLFLIGEVHWLVFNKFVHLVII